MLSIVVRLLSALFRLPPINEFATVSVKLPRYRRCTFSRRAHASISGSMCSTMCWLVIMNKGYRRQPLLASLVRYVANLEVFEVCDSRVWTQPPAKHATSCQRSSWEWRRYLRARLRLAGQRQPPGVRSIRPCTSSGRNPMFSGGRARETPSILSIILTRVAP